MESRPWNSHTYVHTYITAAGDSTETQQMKPKACVYLLMVAHLNEASPAIWEHTVLPATRHRWMHPTC